MTRLLQDDGDLVSCEQDLFKIKHEGQVDDHKYRTTATALMSKTLNRKWSNEDVLNFDWSNIKLPLLTLARKATA